MTLAIPVAVSLPVLAFRAGALAVGVLLAAAVRVG